jgi:16S rRNA (cytosine967-C5)-methyltransferase
VGPRGWVDAADLHPQKLAQLEEELSHLGLRARRTFAVDWSVGTGEVPDLYDAVLVDAPCTGIGTLRRRPELLTRRSADEVAALTRLQIQILLAAASRVKPGGRLVYAVCSVLHEEGQEVVARALAANPELGEAPFPPGAADSLAEGAPTLRLLPHVHGTDGYFVASLIRKTRLHPGPEAITVGACSAQ